MRGFAFVLAILTLSATQSVSAAPTISASAAPQRQEDVTFLGFSENESLAAFAVTVHGASGTFDLVRVVSTKTDQLVGVYRGDGVSFDPEWKAAKPYEAWMLVQARSGFSSTRIDVSKAVFRIALGDNDKVTAKAEKTKITLTGARGSGLHTTPVVRLWDGRNVRLGETRIGGTPGRSLTAEIEAFHSKSGLHIAMLTRYTSIEPSTVRTTDVGRVFTMPNEAIGVSTMTREDISNVADRRAEGLYKILHPEAKELYDQYGRE